MIEYFNEKPSLCTTISVQIRGSKTERRMRAFQVDTAICDRGGGPE
jgi:hypothetical protein